MNDVSASSNDIGRLYIVEQVWQTVNSYYREYYKRLTDNLVVAIGTSLHAVTVNSARNDLYVRGSVKKKSAAQGCVCVRTTNVGTTL